MSLDVAMRMKLAEQLEAAELEVREIDRITDAHPQLNMSEAYDIQYAIRERKLARGSHLVGLKAGLTSRAKMRQMNVSTPVYGFLVDEYAVPDGGLIETKRLIHPKVEPEIAFVMKAGLRGPGCHVADVLAATDFVLPAIEVIDSRYRDFRFDLASVVADNCSSSRFVLGGMRRGVGALDLRTLGIVLEMNGEAVAFGAAAAVLGHPAASVAMLANLLAERGEEIPPGTLILTGGITEAVAVGQGTSVVLHVHSLGSVSVRFC